MSSIGNVLSNLADAKNRIAEQKFDETMAEINETAQEQTTLYGDVEKAGSTLLGSIVGAKTLYGSYKKLKGKYDAFKNKQSGDDDAEAETEAPEVDLEATPDTVGSNLEQMATDGRDFMNNLMSGRSQAPTQDVEMTDMAGVEHAPFERPSNTADSTEPDDAIGELEGADDAVDAVADAVGETADIATSAVSAGLETAGAVADSLAPETFGLGGVVGLILEGIGLATAGSTVVSGIVGSDNAEQAQETATQAAQKTENQAMSQPADVAGRFAMPVQSAMQHINV